MLSEQETIEENPIKISVMKSAVFTVPEKIEINEIPIPELADDEVLIRLEGCGICASNMPVWEGREWFNYPQVAGSPGHEGWGIVADLGKNVKNLYKGDRVAALTYNAFAQFDVAKAENVVNIPKELADLPFPGEPLGCALNIFERSDIKPGQTVAIIGIGFLGSLLTQLVKHAGANVIALSRRSSSLEMAKKCGADETIILDDHWKIIEKIKDLTNGEFCDRVFEATGKEWPLNLAGELTKIRGKLIIAGFHQDGLRQVNVQLWNWRGLDVINAHERDEKIYIEGIQKAVEAVKEGKLDPLPLFTHKFKFDDIENAFRVHASSPEGFMKALIIY